MILKKVSVKTVKPDSDEKTIKKVKKEKVKKEENINNLKREKITNVLDEIKSFLLLAFILFVVALSIYYWYTHFYNENRENHLGEVQEKKVLDYKVVNVKAGEGRTLKVINEKYLVEATEDTIYKITDLKNNVLFEGEFEYSEYYLGLNNEFYVAVIEEDTFVNAVHLYQLENSEFKALKELREDGAYYVPIKYCEQEKENCYLIGYTAVIETIDEEMNDVKKSLVYTLAGEENELQDYQLYGDSLTLKSEERDVISFDSKYIIINSIKDKNKFGLYDIEDNKVIIKPQYEGLYTNKEDEYIVVKNKKYGIINKTLKKLVDFQYDFIDKNEEYYVVAKNNKMAIMNEDYTLVTDFAFDYQTSSDVILYSYLNDKSHFNTFHSEKVLDTYILTINNNEYLENLNYDKHETYFINKKGEYKTILANEFYVNRYNGLIYSFDKEKRVYTFYNQNLEEKFKIDISGYDYDKRAIVSLVHGNTLKIKLDSEIYYDYETGEEISEIKDSDKNVDDIKILFNGHTKELSYQVDGKALANIKNVSDEAEELIKVSEQMYYFLTENECLILYKGE